MWIKAWTQVHESITFLKILTDQNICKQLKAFQEQVHGDLIWVSRGQGSFVLASDLILSPPRHLWGLGQKYKRKAKPVSKYFKVINRILIVNRLFSKIRSIVLPGKLLLHNDQQARFVYRVLGFSVLPESVVIWGELVPSPPLAWPCAARTFARPDSVPSWPPLPTALAHSPGPKGHPCREVCPGEDGPGEEAREATGARDSKLLGSVLSVS